MACRTERQNPHTCCASRTGKARRCVNTRWPIFQRHPTSKSRRFAQPSGRSVRPINELWQTTRSRSHGAVQVVRAAMQRLRFESLIASLRDGGGARVLAPHRKLTTTRWRRTTALAEECGVVQTDETGLSAAISRLYERREFYEANLRPPREPMQISSSYPRDSRRARPRSQHPRAISGQSSSLNSGSQPCARARAVAHW